MTPLLLFLALQADGIAEWIDGLGDEDVEVRESATQALRTAGDRALPALIAAAEATDPEIRSRALSLLEEAARHAPMDSLCLSLDDPLPGAAGIQRVTLRATNAGLLPVLVHRPSLGISGLACSPPGNPTFAWLEPGDTLQIEMEGPVFRGPVTLRPFYMSPTAARTITILPLTNVDPSDALTTLEDLFIRGVSREPETLRFACDPRTRTIIVEGDGDLLEIVEQVVAELDRAAVPRPGPRRFQMGHRDAIKLELLLKGLVLPAGDGRK